MAHELVWVDYNNYNEMLTPEQQQKLVVIATSLQQLEKGWVIFNHEKNRPVRLYNYLEDLFYVPWQNNGIGLVVLKVDGEPIGMYRVVLDESDLSVGTILTVVIDETHRDKGYGKILMQESTHLLAERGIFTTQLSFDSANPAAKQFYASLGYIERTTVMMKGSK